MSALLKMQRSRLLIVATTISGVLLSLQILRWPLIAFLSIFIEPFLELLAGFTFLVVATVCVVVAIRTRKQIARSTWAANLVCLSTAVIVLTVPFDRIYLNLNFRLLETRRTAVAERYLASTEDQAPNSVARGREGDVSFINFPDAGYLTDGIIVVDRTGGKRFVLFLTYRGILERFSGFAYSETGDPPAKTEFGGDGREIERMGPHWFWYSS